MNKRLKASIVLGTSGFALILGAAACETGTDGDATTKAPPAKSGLRPTPTANPESEDLTSFEIDDRSVSGLINVWLTWTITNSSSEKSDYSWDWEAVAPNGDRVASSTEYEQNVRPGQTVKGEIPTALNRADVKINVIEFERTRAY